MRINNTKGRKKRLMPLSDLPPEVLKLLEQLRQARKEAVEAEKGIKLWEATAQEALLVSESGQPFRSSGLSSLVKEQLRKKGFEEVTLHDLRKGGANWRYYRPVITNHLASSPRPLSALEISKRLGHAGLLVTFKCYLKGLDQVQRLMAQNLTLRLSTIKLLASEGAEATNTTEWTLAVTNFARLLGLSRQQCYNLLAGRKLTLEVARQLLEQEIVPAFSSCPT